MTTLTHTGRGVHTGQHVTPQALDVVAYVGNNSIVTGSVTSPAQRQAGDLLIAFLAGNNGLTHVNSPTGYTAGNQQSAPFNMASRILSRVATNTGGDDVGWTMNATGQLVGLFTIRTPYATLTWPTANSNVDNAAVSPAVASVTVPTATAPATGWDLIFAMTYTAQSDPKAIIALPPGFDQVLQQEFLSAGSGVSDERSTFAIFSRLIVAGATGTTVVSAQSPGGSSIGGLELLAQRLVLTP